MTERRSWIGRIGTWATIGFGSVATLFVAGYAWEDPGGWVGLGMTAVWILPMLLSMWFANWRPESTWLLMRLLVALVLLGAAALWLWPRQWSDIMDANGPIYTIFILVVMMSLAAWSRHEAKSAGGLLIITGFAPLLVDFLARGAEGGRIPGSSSTDIVGYAALAGGLLIWLGSRLPAPTPR